MSASNATLIQTFVRFLPEKTLTINRASKIMHSQYHVIPQTLGVTDANLYQTLKRIVLYVCGHRSKAMTILTRISKRCDLDMPEQNGVGDSDTSALAQLRKHHELPSGYEPEPCLSSPT